MKTLAVLPLNNLSADPSQAYIADAMTEELITSIAQIDSLRVISRTSVMGYKDVRKPLPQIARELNADFILEGSILMIGNKMRITSQLIDARSDQHIWAQSYDRDTGDVLSLLNEVASSISGEIQVKITPEEKAKLAGAGQVSPEAYQAYLRGRYLLYPPDLSATRPELAVQMLERAVELDPNFALAYSALSYAYSISYRVDKNPETLKKAKAAVDRAFQLQPGMGEAHVSLGYYYYSGFRDFDRALQEYSIAKKKLPGNTTLLSSMSAVYRRNGDFAAAEAVLKERFEYSPREALAALEAAQVLGIRRRYAEADRYNDIAISLAPDQPSGYDGKARNYLLWTGDTEQARVILQKMPSTDDNQATFTRFLVAMCRRDYDSALKVATGKQPARLYAFLAGYALDRAGRTEEALRFYREARVQLEESIKVDGSVPGFHATLGCTLAVLGEKESAIREANQAVALIPVSKDALVGPDLLEMRAFIYTLVGERDLAVESLHQVLSIPSRSLSVAMLRIDPRWDSLRDHPGFKKLVRP